jgi:hypothetical protein
MVSIVGEEYLCYCESNTGQYSPLISISKYDGTLGFRDMIKDDLTRIVDPEIFPGGWLFRRTMSSTGSWVKRFTILRGNFLFLFHNPQNEKPIGIIPLEGCKLIVPENEEKSFEEGRSFKANDGYEFDIRHGSRPTVRLYALSALERSEWVTVCKRRVDIPIVDCGNNSDLIKLLPPKTNITITTTKLSGLSTDSFANENNKSQMNLSGRLVNSGTAHLNLHSPPPQQPYSDFDNYLNIDSESILQGTIASYNSPTPSHDPMNQSFGSVNSLPPPPPPPPAQLPPNPFTNYPKNQSTQLSSTPEWSAAVGAVATPNKDLAQPQVAPLKFTALSAEVKAIKKIKKSILEAKFAHLENNLSKIVQEQKEARVREDAMRSKLVIYCI